ncbi:transposase [Sorangium sp. So ce281]|uniref:transposase n=1 Tax=Sorangium sp. So ce281 TaxID=3133293 RepID=UPI003F5DFA94
MPKPSHLRAVDPTPAPAAQGAAARPSGAAVESVPKPGKRRKFSAAEKLRIVREAAACTQRGDIEALLRREGIYSSLLAAWRKQLALHGSEALAERKPGRKPKQDAKDRRIAELEERSAARGEARVRREAHRPPKESLCHSGRQSHDRRRALMDVIEELDDPHIPIAQACAALGVSRATLYRQTRPASPPAPPRPA